MTDGDMIRVVWDGACAGAGVWLGLVVLGWVLDVLTGGSDE